MWRITCEGITPLKSAFTNGGTRCFFFLWDVTVTNMYIMYFQSLQRLSRSEEGITYLQFRKALTHNWRT